MITSYFIVNNRELCTPTPAKVVREMSLIPRYEISISKIIGSKYAINVLDNYTQISYTGKHRRGRIISDSAEVQSRLLAAFSGFELYLLNGQIGQFKIFTYQDEPEINVAIQIVQ